MVLLQYPAETTHFSRTQNPVIYRTLADCPRNRSLVSYRLAPFLDLVEALPAEVVRRVRK